MPVALPTLVSSESFETGLPCSERDLCFLFYQGDVGPVGPVGFPGPKGLKVSGCWYGEGAAQNRNTYIRFQVMSFVPLVIFLIHLFYFIASMPHLFSLWQRIVGSSEIYHPNVDQIHICLASAWWLLLHISKDHSLGSDLLLQTTPLGPAER